MNIKKLLPLSAVAVMGVVSGCASHTYNNNIDYNNPAQGIHAIDLSRGTSHDSMGIYHKEIQNTVVVTTNADGSTYTDHSAHYDRGFHMPFGGGGGGKEESCSSEFKIPAVPDCPGQQSYCNNQPMVNPPSPLPPQMTQPAVTTGRNVYVATAPVLYGVPRLVYCVPQQRIRYYPPRPWWRYCRP